MKYGFKSLCIFVLAMRKCCHFLLVFVLFACEEKSNEDAEEFQNSTEITISTIPDSVKRNFNEHLRYTLQSAFQISLDEKYTSQIVETDFNGDGVLDKIISINRLEKANLDLKTAENPAKSLEMGQMGNYNHFILYNGKDSTFISPVVVPSSPYTPLVISSVALKNEVKSEIQLAYRIRNSAYRSFYTIQNNQAKIIFQWKLFDGLGTKNDEAYFIEVGNSGKSSEFKDLYIYKANLQKLPKKENPYTFNPLISKKEGIFTTFFYLDKEGKYYTLPQ